MKVILLKILSILIIIISGYTLKKLSFFSKTDYKLISKIALNITLPATTILSFKTFQKDLSLLGVIPIGIICNLILLSVGGFISRKKDDKLKALYIISGSGYNIGSFTLPFLYNFIGPLGVICTCMFDTGNAPFCVGGSYSFANLFFKKNDGENLIKSLSKLLYSIPFITYIIMLFITFSNITLPESFYSLISPIGISNTFLSMLMIGMMFEVEFKKEYLFHSASILIIRYSMATIFALIFYFLLPFSLEIKKILILLMFAPISGVGPIFVDKCNGDVGLASFISSVSIIISVIIMSSLMFFI